jgi:3-deoxy-D-manno-octulosonic-acid transferase
MWRVLYSVVLLLVWPLLRVRLWLRGRRDEGYAERVPERFGHVPASVPPGGVWFHAVSAGETIAASAVIDELVRTFASLPFVVTTMTPTGSAEVRARLGERVHHCYAPYDFPWAIRRFYRTVQPRLLVLMETELWPNLVAGAHARGIPVLLVNARLSERSARGYRHLGALSRRMLRQISCIACQYPDHAARFIALGAPAERVLTVGSVKFDAALPDDHGDRVAAWRRRFGFGDGPVWIAGSTHPGEEEQVLGAHRRLSLRLPGVRLVLVPRHPERSDVVAQQCRSAGWRVAMLSQPSVEDARADIVVGDRMGTLLDLYGVANVAFVGGSLVSHGGHNPIEPALCGKPVLMGPHVFNFAEVVAEFRRRSGLTAVADGAELAQRLAELFGDPASAGAQGARAHATVTANLGARDRLVALIGTEIRALGATSRNGD